MNFAKEPRIVHESARTEQAEFVRLWTMASPRVHVYILTMVMNWADADDLLQDVGVTAWEKFSEYDRSREFVPWACGIARNKILLFKRNESRCLAWSPDLIDRIEQAGGVSGETQVDEYRESLQKCLDELSPSDRQLLAVWESPRETIKKAAQELERSVEALYKSVQRLRVRVFECVSRRRSSGGAQ